MLGASRLSNSCFDYDKFLFQSCNFKNYMETFISNNFITRLIIAEGFRSKYKELKNVHKLELIFSSTLSVTSCIAHFI